MKPLYEFKLFVWFIRLFALFGVGVVIYASIMLPYIHFTNPETDQTHFGDIGVFVPISIVFLISAYMIWEQWSLKHQNCAVCKRKALDLLWLDNKKTAYCRSHLVEKFAQDFVAYPDNLIVFFPDFEEKGCGGMYAFYPFSEIGKRFRFPQPMIENLKRIISGVSGNCQQCGQREASVAFFGKDILKFEFEEPKLDQVKEKPQYLCKYCSVDQIKYVLQGYSKPLNDNGLYLPFKGQGFFVNTSV